MSRRVVQNTKPMNKNQCPFICKTFLAEAKVEAVVEAKV
jgi:hypothetical protein